MAKLKAPLLSLGAAGQLGKALVFFGWKGLDVVREYIIPANPRSTLQTTQRGYLTTAVADVHAAQGHATVPMLAADYTAYALWASAVKAATTWFNQAVKNHIDQLIAGLSGTTYRGGIVTPGVASLDIIVRSDEIDGATITAGNFHYGTSKTALVNTIAAVIIAVNEAAQVTIPGLTAGVKYFIQFRPTAAAAGVGADSGIYHGVPT